MKVELSYIFECANGFKYTRSTPEEIKEIVKSNCDALQELATGENDFVNKFIDNTNPLFLRGSVTTRISDVWQFYTIRTEAKVID